MTSTVRNIITTAIILATILLGSVIAATYAKAGSSDPLHDVCEYEDGSGQRFCIWDAGTAGNGYGDSFIVIRGGTDNARYLYISHKRAYRLTH